ncbi:MAG: hypothetical protein LQ338_008199 [Usnochroma carphineum]|nr:MAG: hypothetical protein LQ338_008199 [Usnochroma carphineum]
MSYPTESEHIPSSNDRASASSGPNLDHNDTASSSNEAHQEKAETSHRLVQLVNELPSELYNIIMANLWEAAFYPGVVNIPTQNRNNRAGDHEKDPDAARPTLMSVSKGVHADHQARFWRENTFFIGVGKPLARGEEGFKGWLGHEATCYIEKVHVTFSIRDLGDQYASCLPRDHPGWSPCPYEEERKRSNALFIEYSKYDQYRYIHNPLYRHDDYGFQTNEAKQLRTHHELMMYELYKIWQEKKLALQSIILTEVTLDLSECYSTGGRWVGDELAKRISLFQYANLEALRVIAPDDAKRARVERILRNERP